MYVYVCNICVCDLCVYDIWVYVCGGCVCVYDTCVYMYVMYVCLCMCVMYVHMCVYDARVGDVCIYMYKMQMCITTLCAVCGNLRKTSGVSSLLPLWVPPGIKLRSSGSRGRCFTHWAVLPPERISWTPGEVTLKAFGPWKTPSKCHFSFLLREKGLSSSKARQHTAQSGVHALCELTPYPLLQDFPLQMLANLPWNGGMRMFSAATGFTQSMCGGRNYARLFSSVTIHTHTQTSTFIFNECLQR